LEDPFGVLGLTPSASKDDIKAAYHSLAKQHHPDTNDGCSDAEDSFKRINEAYEGKL
jgi:molecular chaperone DnaJ